MIAYAAFARTAFQTQLAYRGQVWSSMFGQLVQIFARVAIWTALYAGASSVAGVTLQQMVTYAMLSSTVRDAWHHSFLVSTIDRSLKSGDVAVYLLKPLSYPFFLFAGECGTLIYRLVVIVVPTILVVALTYGILPPASATHGLMFMAFWLLSFAILFLLAAAFGLVAFWLMTAFSLDWTLGALLNLLSGSFLPLWFFPEPLGTLARHLPFAWVGFYPTAVYLGRLDTGECLIYFGIGLGWAAALAAAVGWLWRRASNRIIIQGG